MKPYSALFLDRDGVLNRRIPGDYVRKPGEMELLPGVAEALRLLRPLFERMVVATNQAGIGKGRMDEAALGAVHARMQALILAGGGPQLDAVYFCPHRSEAACACRKPASGMALQAQADFPELDFSRSWMVGDSYSDLAFGLRLGMQAALVRGKAEEEALLADYPPALTFDSLLDFSHYLCTQGAFPVSEP